MEFSTTCEAATVLLLQLFITVFFSFRLLVVYVCWFHIFLSVEWLITFSIHWLPVVYFEYTYFAICSDTILYKLFLTCRSDLIFWFHFSFFLCLLSFAFGYYQFRIRNKIYAMWKKWLLLLLLPPSSAQSSGKSHFSFFCSFLERKEWDRGICGGGGRGRRFN